MKPPRISRRTLLKGLLDGWPARERWRRREFVEAYGAYGHFQKCLELSDGRIEPLVWPAFAQH